MRVVKKTNKYELGLQCVSCSLNNWTPGELYTCINCGYQSLPPSWVKGEMLETDNLISTYESVKESFERRFAELGDLEQAVISAQAAGDDALIEKASFQRAKRELATIEKLLEVLERFKSVADITQKGWLQMYIPELGQAWSYSWGGFNSDDWNDALMANRPKDPKITG